MLDGRILAAVLASLAAIAAGMSGGGISADALKQSTLSAPSDFSFSDLKPDSMNIVDRFFGNSEPTNEMEAVIVSENIESEKFRFRKARVSSTDFTSIEFSGKTLESDRGIELYGFTGEVEPGNVTKLKGKGSGLVTGGVNVSGGLNIVQKIETGVLDINRIKRSSIEFGEAMVDISTDSDNYRSTSPKKVSINSFSGDIRIYLSNSTTVLDGRVDRIESGDFSYGD